MDRLRMLLCRESLELRVLLDLIRPEQRAAGLAGRALERVRHRVLQLAAIVLLDVGNAVIGELDGPGHVALRAVAAAVEEAADAAEAVPEHDTGREDVHAQRERHALL